jgi:hypothetical protein
MANPMKAIKAVTRVVGGITGKGSKNVNPTYAESRANKRGLKAANKTKSGNIKLDKEISDLDAYMKASKQYNLKTGSDKIIAGTANNLKYTPPARPNRVRGGSMGSKLNWPNGMK